MEESFKNVVPNDLIEIDTHVKPLFVDDVFWDGLDAEIKLKGSEQGEYCLIYDREKGHGHLFRKQDHNDAYSSVSYIYDLEIVDSDVSYPQFIIQQRKAVA